jgi:hypothetical protein
MKLSFVFLLLSFVVMAQLMRFDIGDRQINGDDYFAVIEPVFWSVSIYDGLERYERDLAKFSKEQRFVLACHWYMSEVNNGGHDQFYDNSTGIVWKDAREGFIAIGAKEVAAIIDESSRRLGGTPSLDRGERQGQLERFNPQFDDLDNKFFRLDKKLNYERKLMEYIRANRKKFYFSGKVKKP